MPSTSPWGGRDDSEAGVIRSHFLNLVVFSVLVAIFFAFLTQNRTADRLRVIFVLGGAMIVLSLIVAYVMYPFPLQR